MQVEWGHPGCATAQALKLAALSGGRLALADACGHRDVMRR